MENLFDRFPKPSVAQRGLETTRSRLCWATALLGMAAFGADPLHPGYPSAPVSVFIVAGQSNTKGSGETLKVLDYQAFSNLSEMQNRIRVREGPTMTDLSKLHPWISGDQLLKKNSFGPEVGIAASLKNIPGDILILKYAVDGSALAHHLKDIPSWPVWGQRGDSRTHEPIHSIYDQMINALRSAFPQGSYPGREVTVRAFFWMQGETDAAAERTAQLYFSNLTRLIRNLHEDLSFPIRFPATSPFIIGKVSRKPWRFSRIVREAEDRAQHSPRFPVFTVETDDLPKVSDGVHYDYRGLLMMGYRMGKKYLSTLPNPIGWPENLRADCIRIGLPLEP